MPYARQSKPPLHRPTSHQHGGMPSAQLHVIIIMARQPFIWAMLSSVNKSNPMPVTGTCRIYARARARTLVAEDNCLISIVHLHLNAAPPDGITHFTQHGHTPHVEHNTQHGHMPHVESSMSLISTLTFPSIFIADTARPPSSWNGADQVGLGEGTVISKRRSAWLSSIVFTIQSNLRSAP